MNKSTHSTLKDPVTIPELQPTQHLVHRTESHLIDTLAVRKVIAALSANWVIRDLTERDYGIDMMVEYFNGQLPTCRIAFFQVKGTSKPIAFKNGQAGFSLHRKTLGYTECFTVPFFLLYCDVTDSAGTVYYVWLQKYIMTTLHKQSPDWRTSQQESYTIYIPAQNKLQETESRMLEFCQSPQRTTESLQFLGHLYAWKAHYHGLTSGHIEAVTPCVNLLKQMADLKVALSGEDMHVRSDDLIGGIKALKQLQVKGYEKGVEEYASLVELNRNLELFETGVFWTNFDSWKMEGTGEYPY
jgi:hypothetical protein